MHYYMPLLLNLIIYLHILCVLFITCTPFLNSNYFLSLHITLLPFIWIHWVLNDNTCVLTTIEKNIRENMGQSGDDRCFTCKLIEPVYDFKDNNREYSTLIYALTISLWAMSCYNLKSNARKFNDLFKL